MKLLSQEETQLNTAKAQNMEAFDTLKLDLVVKLVEGKKISEELTIVEAAAKEAKMGEEALLKQLEDLQQS